MMIRVAVFLALIGAIVIAVPCVLHAGPTAYIGLYTDEERSNNTVIFSEMWEHFEVWVWVLPGDLGMMCTEFSVDHHDLVIVEGELFPNPECTVNMGNLFYPGGASICFGSCQYDWTWLYRISMYTQSMESGRIEIREHPDAGGLQIANCILPDYPIEEAFIYSEICYARSISPDDYMPIFTELSAPESVTVNITFDDTPAMDFPDFNIYSAADSTDTIQVMYVAHPTYYTWILSLGDPLVDGENYIIEATSFCTYIPSPCGWASYHCYDPQAQFEYHSPVATMLQSFAATPSAAIVELKWEISSIDRGVEFVVFRQKGRGAFDEIERGSFGSGGLVGSGAMTFEYIDETILPGCCYRYRVEYILDGESHVLFITEPVETPAAALSLEQNHPNPFNPSTTISYNLPATGFVSIEIFDVTGRRVKTLVSDVKNPGPHRIEWNGLDETGMRVVSGVYFYRLRAGKEELTKKMVLMR
ncbi:MAG: T9SS type A sorting domain-containing protein [Bacteroidales bacterium]|nr:T9SS type A sorting domain-containing protein [Candidatus Latescibacterota bacterium]